MEFQTELLTLLSDSETKIKNYLNLFDTKDSYLFTANHKKMANIKDGFMLLSDYLVHVSEKTDSLSAVISASVCHADQNMNNELTSYFSNILENYFMWRRALLTFLDNSGSIIMGDGEFKYSLLMSYTQIFLKATENMIGILNIKQ